MPIPLIAPAGWCVAVASFLLARAYSEATRISKAGVN
jgi:hypothetical protein